MTKEERKTFLQIFAGHRDDRDNLCVADHIARFRDNFANEIWSELGYKDQASIFTQTEVPVSLIVLLCMGSLILVKNNIRAFMINHYIIIAGYVLAFISTLLFIASHYQSLSPG